MKKSELYCLQNFNLIKQLFIEKQLIFFRDPRLLKLRHTLIFIIDNLQYYLQVDVLESEYTIMENKMNNTRNFEDVQKAHSVFLANVLSQMFLLETNSAKKRRHPVNCITLK